MTCQAQRQRELQDSVMDAALRAWLTLPWWHHLPPHVTHSIQLSVEGPLSQELSPSDSPEIISRRFISRKMNTQIQLCPDQEPMTWLERKNFTKDWNTRYGPRPQKILVSKISQRDTQGLEPMNCQRQRIKAGSALSLNIRAAQVQKFMFSPQAIWQEVSALTWIWWRDLCRCQDQATMRIMRSLRWTPRDNINTRNGEAAVHLCSLRVCVTPT